MEKTNKEYLEVLGEEEKRGRIKKHFFAGVGEARLMENSERKWNIKTKSLCPECMEVIDAELHEEGGKILINKRCEKHGEFEDVYWGDAQCLP
jgi:hypothetical protein